MGISQHWAVGQCYISLPYLCLSSSLLVLFGNSSNSNSLPLWRHSHCATGLKCQWGPVGHCHPFPASKCVYGSLAHLSSSQGFKILLFGILASKSLCSASGSVCVWGSSFVCLWQPLAVDRRSWVFHDLVVALQTTLPNGQCSSWMLCVPLIFMLGRNYWLQVTKLAQLRPFRHVEGQATLLVKLEFKRSFY